MEHKNHINYLIYDWPVRISRLLRHIISPILRSKANPFPSHNILEWFLDFAMYMMDVLLFPEIHRVILRIFNWHVRPLNDRELMLARPIFNDNIDYNRVLINNKARLISPKLAIAYVTFNTIHYHSILSDDVFIHEMTHIWQYQHFGSIYISKALKAQKNIEGYDYGGVEGLYHAVNTGKKLLDFNFEQQAEIIEEHFRTSLKKQSESVMKMTVYDYYKRQLDIVNNG